MSNTNTTPPAFMRLPEVLRLIPMGKSTWWAGVKEGRFPQPVKLSARITAWRTDDIKEWMAQFAKNPPPQSG